MAKAIYCDFPRNTLNLDYGGRQGLEIYPRIKFRLHTVFSFVVMCTYICHLAETVSPKIHNFNRGDVGQGLISLPSFMFVSAVVSEKNFENGYEQVYSIIESDNWNFLKYTP